MQHIEIRVKGQINRDWSDWLGELAIEHTDDGNTLLSGTIRDQSALRGLLNRLADLGLQLVNVSTENIANTGRGKEV